MSSQDVIGLLPMGGSGTRLGLPFHKALAPTFTEQGIKPLYWHSVQQLLPVTGDIYAPGMGLTDLGQLPELQSRSPGGSWMGGGNTMEETIRNFARDASDETIIVLLPDTIMMSEYAIRDAYNWYLKQDRPAIMPVLMHPADEDQLDQYEYEQFVPHRPGGKRKGWGALIGRHSWFLNIDPNQPIAYQLNRTGFTVYQSQTTIFDLGTPERYESYIDLRKQFRG